VPVLRVVPGWPWAFDDLRFPPLAEALSFVASTDTREGLLLLEVGRSCCNRPALCPTWGLPAAGAPFPIIIAKGVGRGLDAALRKCTSQKDVKKLADLEAVSSAGGNLRTIAGMGLAGKAGYPFQKTSILVRE
jgi:hypothetical protein